MYRPCLSLCCLRHLVHNFQVPLEHDIALYELFTCRMFPSCSRSCSTCAEPAVRLVHIWPQARSASWSWVEGLHPASLPSADGLAAPCISQLPRIQARKHESTESQRDGLKARDAPRPSTSEPHSVMGNGMDKRAPHSFARPGSDIRILLPQDSVLALLSCTADRPMASPHAVLSSLGNPRVAIP